MKHQPDLEAIEARKREIDEQIAALRQEADELDVALRVFHRFSEPEMASAAKGIKLGVPRPEGIPTLFEMTYEIIREAEQQGKEGILAKDIVEKISQRYWPGVQGPQILPPIYSMAKKGRLRKLANGLFQTVRKEEAPTEKSASASTPGTTGVHGPDMFSKP